MLFHNPLESFKMTFFLSVDWFQVTASDQTRVVIEDVQINFSGTYLCEVTVMPSYFALMQYANMTIVGESFDIFTL